MELVASADIAQVFRQASRLQQKPNFPICYLDGVAREKIEELSGKGCTDYSVIVAHLWKFFEESQHCYVARQFSLACKRIISDIHQPLVKTGTNWTGANASKGVRAREVCGGATISGRDF
ncbi:hypothetical protein ANCDUO_00094 [Ancylostoma duodenale]|uniref:Uncharacterized protein n=1 Tax=Ancylostoma duodenale TaxID=51022 RepID=A0A0C2H6Q5_9BILA|nr:hypothetical protein ANCDUO_00094 [Ancylostoma duodenale]